MGANFIRNGVPLWSGFCISDIRVQCLGKDYPPTEAAWQCLAEVRQLRKEHEQDPKAPDNDREKVFAEVQQKFINERPRQGAVHCVIR